MQKTFLITGGAGFIGTTVVNTLLEHGHTVRVVDDLSAGKRDRVPVEAQFFEGDIRNVDAMTNYCEDVDIIVHLAAVPRVQFSIEHPIISHDVNVNGTLAVLEAAKRAGVKRIIHASSSSVYGDQDILPLSVDAVPTPKSPYALHKYVNEVYMKLWAELYGLETISLRFFNVYGPHLDPDGPYALVIGKFLQQRKNNQPLTITGDGEQTRDFTHVIDVTAAIMKAAEAEHLGKGEVCNVGSGTQTSVRSLAGLIGGEVAYLPPRIEPKHTQADISHTKTLLGWTPTISLEEGITQLKKEWGL